MAEMNPIKRWTAVLALALTPMASATAAEEPVLNLYSARHYQTDEALYANFTKATGIRINRIEASDDQLVERLKTEGANSPGDVLLIVDASRLVNAEQLGFFKPVSSKILETRIPAHLRDPQGEWFAFSMRGRFLVYNRAMLAPGDIPTYASLADPKLKGKVCTRSGAHPYNVSLIASQISHVGEEKAESWARGVVANLARKPQGGDTDQIRAVAAGECAVAVSNTYYYARLVRSTKAADREVVAKTGVVFPDQSGAGTHVNVSGAGVLKHAPHPENAVKFLEYLASDEAQVYFADGNNEWPAVPSVNANNPALDAMGEHKFDKLPIASFAANIAKAQKIADRTGWR